MSRQLEVARPKIKREIEGLAASPGDIDELDRARLSLGNQKALQKAVKATSLFKGTVARRNSKYRLPSLDIVTAKPSGLLDFIGGSAAAPT